MGQVKDILTESNVRWDGQSYAGDVLSISIPTPTPKMRTIEAGGMSGSAHVPLGKVEPMEATLEFAGFALGFHGKLAFVPGTEGVLRALGVLTQGNGEQYKAEVILSGYVGAVNSGMNPNGENNSSVTFKVNNYKLIVDGRTVTSIDPELGTAIVRGVDLRSAINSILEI